MAQPENATPERMFTDEQIAKVKAKLLKNPAAMKALLSSAQSGNQEDLQFIVEADLMLTTEDGGKKSGVYPMNRGVSDL